MVLVGRPKGTPKTGGRKKGTPNKATVKAKDEIAAVADRLGGVDRLVAWVQEDPPNERIFWASIYPRLITVQIQNDQDEPQITRIERIIVHHDSERARRGECDYPPTSH